VSALEVSVSGCFDAGVAGAEVGAAEEPATGAESERFCALLALLRRECGVAGGGDVIRGDVGGGCAASFTAAASLSCFRGSFESGSGVFWLWASCGMLEADSARWIAAADGGAEEPLLFSGETLSLRMGEVCRDVRGLVPVKGDARRAKLLEEDVRKTGLAVGMGCGCV
jgi:hypothetical protein